MGTTITLMFTKNALDFATGGDYQIKVKAPRSVHVNVIAAQDDPSHFVVSLVNTTGVLQRPLKEIVPVKAEFTIPLRGRKLKASKTLWGKADIAADADKVTVSIPVLEDFASVEIQL
jgi:hypothetical protein